jgi:hypothetical protein
MLARIATDPRRGTIAVVSVGLEEVPMLRVVSPEGAVLAERRLLRMTPDRDWVTASPSTMSGLSFSGDGRFLFVLNDDLIERGDTRAQLWKLDASTLELVQLWTDLGRGQGGSVSADGTRYTFVELPPRGRARIVERELDSGKTTVLYEADPSVGVGAPSWNASHTQLAFSVHDGDGWNLAVLGPDGSTRQLTHDRAFNYAPRWVDDRHLVFARVAGSYLQVHRLDLESGLIEPLSDTPYGIIDPSPVPGGVAVVNRDGTGWSLDVVSDKAKAAVATAVEPLPFEPLAVEPLAVEPLAIDEASLEPIGITAAPTEATPRHEPPPLIVEEDSAYSPLDHLFIPQLRAPGVTFGLASDEAGQPRLFSSLYASLAGRDRLGLHSWAINGRLDVPGLSSLVSVAYRNLQLAPWSLTAQASREGDSDIAYWSGALSVDRTFFTAPLSFGARAEVAQPFAAPTQRYLGPFFSFAWAATESTAYGGVQRHLAFSLDAAGYPRAIGSTRDMLDLRLGVSAAVPLPVSKRHSLLMTLVGRVLPGAPDGSLRVGGLSRGYALMNASGTSPVGPGVFLPGGLVEGVRGFDDQVVRATAAAIGTARYRYSFIIDRGFLSTFYLFPSIFFRQVDAELFGAAALTDNVEATWARSAGGAVFLRLIMGGAVAFSMYYQFAWRFDFGLPPLHALGFALE